MKDSESNTITLTFQAFETMPEKLSDFLDAYFEVSALNYTKDNKEQYVAYATSDFNEKDFKKSAQKAGVCLPSYKIETLKTKNWLTANVIKFEPQEVADFCVYGIHQRKAPKTKKIPIQVYAATAFGSTHQTTHMCLTAISDLAKFEKPFKRILDVGTGSGILSIAVAKKFKKYKPSVLGVDIDRESVNVAVQNAFTNNVEDCMDVFYSDGFKSKEVRSRAPYDLIFANILARPLILMAKDMAKTIFPKGFIVLSGFTADQSDWVLQTYQKAGFKLLKLYQKEHWRAALMQKKEKLSDIQQTLLPSQAILLERNNMFLGEDILDSENKILELSGFTGSAGMMLILKNKAYLFIDGRYSIQAKKEALKEISVINSQNFFSDAVQLFKKHKLKNLILNPWAVSSAETDFLQKENISLVFDENAPMSSFCGVQKVFKQPLSYAGLSSAQKAFDICKKMKKKFDALLISSAEEVSWLSNLRAVDLPDTPVLRSYALLYQDGKLKVYAFEKRKTLLEDLKKCKHVIVRRSQTPAALLEQLKNAEDIGFDALTKAKLSKNPTELKGYINSHIRDGVALVKFFSWLEQNAKGLTELDIVQKLHDFRAQNKLYFSESFGTIAAVNQNAAIVHYQPTIKSNKKLTQNAVLLLDSGAQYFDGTTDVTRTVAFGRVKNEVKQDFTLVLKAHIALASLQFKRGTPANELDKICRAVLLAQGKDFKHGTGHSVGHFSNVHEAPFAINPKNTTPVLENYVTSIEPGFYKENVYGIRIENLVYTAPSSKKGYLQFKPLTLCPIDSRLIDLNLLTKEEKKWLNAYHSSVFETLKPYLKSAERKWLEKACREL